MADLRNCSECGGLFVFMGRDVCPKCIEKEEEDFDAVRKYVREHSGASVVEVAEATGIDEERILHFLREGRLISKGLRATAVFNCERCGKRIESGRFWRACAEELDSGLQQSLQDITGVEREERSVTRHGKDRMHIKSGKSFDQG